MNDLWRAILFVVLLLGYSYVWGYWIYRWGVKTGIRHTAELVAPIIAFSDTWVTGVIYQDDEHLENWYRGVYPDMSDSELSTGEYLRSGGRINTWDGWVTLKVGDGLVISGCDDTLPSVVAITHVEGVTK